jgi:hypothetical protein
VRRSRPDSRASLGACGEAGQLPDDQGIVCLDFILEIFPECSNGLLAGGDHEPGLGALLVAVGLLERRAAAGILVSSSLPGSRPGSRPGSMAHVNDNVDPAE